MMRTRLRTSRAFSLIEVLIYLALFSMVVGGFCMSAALLFETGDRATARALVREDAQFVLAKGERMINMANTIDTPLQNESGTALTVHTGEGSETLCLSGETVRFARGDIDACVHGDALTDASLHVVQFRVDRRTQEYGGERIHVSIQVRASAPRGGDIEYTATSTASRTSTP